MGRSEGASLFIAMGSLGTKATNTFARPPSFNKIYHFTTWDQLTPAQLFISVENFFSRREIKFLIIMLFCRINLVLMNSQNYKEENRAQCSFMCSKILPSSISTTRSKGLCQNGMACLTTIKSNFRKYRLSYSLYTVFVFIGFFLTITVFVFFIVSLCSVIYSSVFATENWNRNIGWSSLWISCQRNVNEGV